MYWIFVSKFPIGNLLYSYIKVGNEIFKIKKTVINLILINNIVYVHKAIDSHVQTL